MADILDENGEAIWDSFGSVLTDEQVLTETPWGNTTKFSGIITTEEFSGIIIED